MVAALAACSAFGYVLARQADDYIEAQHRRALAGAIEALQAMSPDLAGVDARLIRVLERASGLADLRFDPAPAGDGRRVQPMFDRNRRIVGWFSWRSEQPAGAMMRRLLPLAAGLAAGLVAFAALAIWQLGRLGVRLARSEQHVRRLERQDGLTGLPNHARFFALFDRALADGERPLAYAALDLDGFDEVNDVLGHAGGDEVLVEISRRFTAVLPRGAVIARLGSDEFALMLPDAAPETALAAVQALCQSLAWPVAMHQSVTISACAGVAAAPRDGTSRDELARRADLALRAAKRRGRGVAVTFSPELEADLQERRFIRREAAYTLAAHGFELHYQPIVKADGGAIAGVEALLRWNHPARGNIAPAQFVPIAEEAGLMQRLGEFALRRAIADAAHWPDLYVSVNVSPLQMRDRAIVDVVASVLKDSGFDPARLVLEMTESVLIDEPEAIAARLQDLRALGVGLALDDFGSGYSSLRYLQTLPFDKLKIDRGFVQALDRSANGGVIIQAMVALGRALGLSVVIEGVETEEQRVLLRLAGCHEMQGYLFARPAPREEIGRLLHARRAAPDHLRLRAVG
jgi:diguanylate cyclase (GGDEF)-like protein